jgi:hypothetical protein
MSLVVHRGVDMVRRQTLLAQSSVAEEGRRVYTLAEQYPVEADRSDLDIIVVRDVWIGGNPGIDHSFPEQLNRSLIVEEVEIIANPAFRHRMA